ncbi:MAG: CvpA family protein [Isosphaeraceae bacterium]
MGLDLTLGGLVLLVGIRGWLRGFTIQAIRLGGLVASAYLAAPARDQIKPYALSYLPTIRPDLVDRLLWWASAAVCYFVIVGVVSLAFAVSRRQPHGLEESNRSDQFAGLGLGVLKGTILAAFLLAGLQRYATPYLPKVTWVQEQVKDSAVWAWSLKYRPAEKIWNSPPVQEFVTHVKKMGMNPPEAPKTEAVGAEAQAGTEPTTPKAEADRPVQTASRTPQLTVPSGSWGFGGISEAVRSILPGDSP